MKRTLLILLLLAALLASCTGLAFAAIRTPAIGDDTFPVYFDGERTGFYGYYYRGNIYLTPQLYQSYGDCSRVTFDTDARRVTFDAADFALKTADDALSAFIRENAGACYIRIASWNASVRHIVSADAIGKLVGLSAEIDLSARRILLSRYDLSANAYATLARDVSFVPSLATFTTDSRVLAAGTSVILEDETAHYAKIRTSAGLEGYVRKSAVVPYETDLA